MNRYVAGFIMLAMVPIIFVAGMVVISDGQFGNFAADPVDAKRAALAVTAFVFLVGSGIFVKFRSK